MPDSPEEVFRAMFRQADRKRAKGLGRPFKDRYGRGKKD